MSSALAIMVYEPLCSLRKHPFLLALRRLGPKREEKRMFSQASHYTMLSKYGNCSRLLKIKNKLKIG